MSPRMPTPTEVGSVTEKLFRVTWSDGHRSVYSWMTLRVHCPCARCKGEWKSPRPQLTARDIPEDIRAMSVQRVGAYALRFIWSDGHDTGIYPFVLLRNEVCECDECAARRSNARST